MQLGITLDCGLWIRTHMEADGVERALPYDVRSTPLLVRMKSDYEMFHYGIVHRIEFIERVDRMKTGINSFRTCYFAS